MAAKAMDRKTLDQISVASPCTVSWASMRGDEQVRHCGDCKQNVYNLSTMSLPEITHLLEKKEGRTCVRFYRRADGTVLTDDCPVGLRAVRRRMAMVAAAAGTLLSALGLGMFLSRGLMGRTLRDSSLAKIQIVRELADWMDPRQPMRVTMGAPMAMSMGRPSLPICGTEATPGPAPEVSPRATMGEMVSPEVLRKPVLPQAGVEQGRR